MLKGQNIEREIKTKDIRSKVLKAEWDILLNGKKRRTEIMSKVINRMGHNGRRELKNKGNI
jgi:hypothetical protein